MRPTVLIAALLLAAPVASRADVGLTLELMGGYSTADFGSLKSGVTREGASLLSDRMTFLGGMALARFGSFDLGVIYEGGRLASKTDSAVITPTFGFAIPLTDLFRVDLLGEIGAHQISGIEASSGSVNFSQATAVWLPQVGVRPMLTLRIPMAVVSLDVSLSGFARWDIQKRSVTLSGPAGSVSPAYSLGGATYGLALGAGVEF